MPLRRLGPRSWKKLVVLPALSGSEVWSQKEKIGRTICSKKTPTMTDDDFLDDEADNEYEEEELTESPKVAVSRATRVKVFGRDLWGKSQLKAKILENDKVDLTSECTIPQSDVSEYVEAGFTHWRSKFEVHWRDHVSF